MTQASKKIQDLLNNGDNNNNDDNGEEVNDIDKYLKYGRYQATRIWGLGSLLGKCLNQQLIKFSISINRAEPRSGTKTQCRDEWTRVKKICYGKSYSAISI